MTVALYTTGICGKTRFECFSPPTLISIPEICETNETNETNGLISALS